VDEDERDRLDLGNRPTVWLAEHRLVFLCLLAVIAGTLGYFGLLGGTTPQRVSPGIAGLIWGVGSVIVVFLVVLGWTRLRRR
jgi:hypothetical protein